MHALMHASVIQEQEDVINYATMWLSQQGFFCSRALVDDTDFCYNESWKSVDITYRCVFNSKQSDDI
jgi:hypothetical protein